MVSKRQTNFELLRIVAMLMIISLHYMVKGYMQSEGVNSAGTPLFYIVRLIEAFCIVAVNCYVLISGYFLVESEWKVGRIVSLLAQVLFYSLLVPIVMLCFGMVSLKDLDIYDWFGYIFPIQTEHYWFATAYLIMYIFAPLLAAGVKNTDKKTLQKIIIALLIFISVGKSVLPVNLATDSYGYNYGWFLCLFLTAAYIRLYCPDFLKKRKNALLLYVGLCLCIFGLSFVSDMLGQKIEAFSYYSEMPYTYNHLLCLGASVGLFGVFMNTEIRENKFARTIRRLAPYTFGAYLLHEHILVRYEWPGWLHIEEARDGLILIPHMICSVAAVFAVGTLVDFIREYLFKKTALLFGLFRRKFYERGK